VIAWGPVSFWRRIVEFFRPRLKHEREAHDRRTLIASCKRYEDQTPREGS
jgi:hypothetical protein